MDSHAHDRVSPLGIARVLIVTGIVAGVVLLAAAGYVFRGHLHAIPLVGRWVAASRPAPAWVCPMHPEVRRATPGTCPKCGMDLVLEQPGGASHDHGPGDEGGDAATEAAGAGAAAAPTPRAGLTIDTRRRQLVGVRLAEVTRTAIARQVRASGIVQYDETRQADINLKVEAWIQDLYVDYTGQFIRRGQPLFTVYSPDLVATQNEYVLALETRDRLRGSQVADARDYADRLVAATRQRLALWDLSADQIERLERTREAERAVVFRSPVSGYVIEKRAVQGMRATPGESLYRVADLSVVWVEADLYESELPYIAQGARATVSIDAYPGETFAGKVTYVYPYVAEKSRTIRVRIELPNRGGKLKPGMFATVELAASMGEGLTVPADAVVDSGTDQFVFRAVGEGYFEPRRVEVGQRLPDAVQIVKGLSAGDRVASGATFFIDSESQLRAAMQGFDESAAPDASAGGESSGDAGGVQVAFATVPNPPRNGDNTFEVRLRDADGAAITDAQVTVRLYMPPMPSMNMPAMKAEARLLHAGDGVYRGHGNVSMAGRWEVTVVASRAGATIAQRPFSIVAQ